MQELQRAIVNATGFEFDTLPIKYLTPFYFLIPVVGNYAKCEAKKVVGSIPTLGDSIIFNFSTAFLISQLHFTVHTQCLEYRAVRVEGSVVTLVKI